MQRTPRLVDERRISDRPQLELVHRRRVNDRSPDSTPGAASKNPPVNTTPTASSSPHSDSYRVSSIATSALAIMAAMPIIYFGKVVIVTVLFSVLLAFILEPLVRLFEKARLPRPFAALLTMVVLLGAVYAASYFSYLKAVDFAHQLPKYSQRIRSSMDKLRNRTQQIQQTTKEMLPDQNKDAVKVQQVDQGVSGYLSAGSGLTEAFFSVSFVPFLAFFMLTWRDHMRRSVVLLFPRESRNSAYVAVSNIADMLRQFIVGNLLIGVMVGAANAAAFWALHIPYFYFVGPISGFLSLVPYLGVLLALVPPMAAGLGQLSTTGMVLVAVTVLGSHLVALNVLYPKILGKRLELNPLIVTFALLFWGFFWGAMGLILAIPVTAAIKIVLEHIEGLHPLAYLLGEGKEIEPA